MSGKPGWSFRRKGVCRMISRHSRSRELGACSPQEPEVGYHKAEDMRGASMGGWFLSRTDSTIVARKKGLAQSQKGRRTQHRGFNPGAFYTICRWEVRLVQSSWRPHSLTRCNHRSPWKHRSTVRTEHRLEAYATLTSSRYNGSLYQVDASCISQQRQDLTSRLQHFTEVLWAA
jgi:hypothetical protein